MKVEIVWYMSRDDPEWWIRGKNSSERVFEQIFYLHIELNPVFSLLYQE